MQRKPMSVLEANAALKMAVKMANTSPCQKSKRGVAVVTQQGRVFVGHNHPPRGFVCDAACLASGKCARSAVHAEMDALANARYAVFNAEVVHVKVVDGAAVASGGPSCVECSKAILDAGCSAVWLLHEDGLKRYPADEFHRLSLQANALPVCEP